MGSTAPITIERSLEKALGIQIRALRRQHDLSVADLASAAGISNGMLSKIEWSYLSVAVDLAGYLAGSCRSRCLSYSPRSRSARSTLTYPRAGVWLLSGGVRR